MSLVKLSDVASFSKGQQINGDALISDGAYAYLNGGINPSGRWSNYNASGNTITISEGGNSCGYVNYMQEPFWCGAHCYYLYDLKCNAKYLYYALSSQQNRLMAIRSGACMPNIKKADLGRFSFQFDNDLCHQEKVVTILDVVSALMARCKRQLSDLDLLVKSQFVEMFGNIIENTKQWPIYRLEEIATSRLGKMLDAKKQTGEYPFPYLANTNVQWFRFDLSELRQMDFAPEDQVEFELQDGDLMVCEGGEVGRCAVWHNEITPCFFQKAIHRVRCNPEYILPEYLAFWFKHHSEFNAFEDIVGSVTTIAHLPGVKLKNLNIVVPPVDLQKQFVILMAQADKSKFAAQQALDDLTAAQKALMRQYLG